jgi:hypothetical protein
VNEVRPVREAAKLSAICEPTVYALWDPQHLRTLQAVTSTFALSVMSVVRINNGISPVTCLEVECISGNGRARWMGESCPQKPVTK